MDIVTTFACVALTIIAVAAIIRYSIVEKQCKRLKHQVAVKTAIADSCAAGEKFWQELHASCHQNWTALNESCDIWSDIASGRLKEIEALEQAKQCLKAELSYAEGAMTVQVEETLQTISALQSEVKRWQDAYGTEACDNFWLRADIAIDDPVECDDDDGSTDMSDEDVYEARQALQEEEEVEAALASYQDDHCYHG